MVCCMQNNFGRPVEWAMEKDFTWSTPQLRKLEKPVNVHVAFHGAAQHMSDLENVVQSHDDAG